MCPFRRLIAICCLMGIAPYVAAAEPVKIGILGLDNYQATEYAAFFNNPKAEGDLAGLRVTAAYPVTSPDYPMSAEFTAKWQAQLLALFKDDPTVLPIELVSSIDELLPKCDAVMSN